MTDGTSSEAATRSRDLAGKTAIVTGANSGIGFHVAQALASRGAATVLAVRDPVKGARAAAAIGAAYPDARVRCEDLDLDSLAAVADFAGRWTGPLDILVNNAAVMALPARETTADGFERQIGVNYLAHFALTGRLSGALNAAPNGGRVVNVASLAHRRAVLRLDDLQSQAAYSPAGAYRQSKLAMLMFSLELHRRSQAHGWALRAFAAHPGWARTNIIPNGPGRAGRGIKVRLMQALFGLAAQSARDGALPIVFAATAPDAEPGGYYGPDGRNERRGPPAPAAVFPQARDRQAAAALWTVSEALTGVTFG
ncbi:MAG TPA: SDR family oxidoreductase [Rhodopila sp.]|uniref:SDR family oxidoreductase n=1 Tax=Rhodopila sp. TaxID=2480087 RepID=UPI002C98E0DA|nr:SDR family oxidoreductase [Rhodopila sp.]HVY17821.1 SDR family oxidoreductase [Rhodopila sp.]